MQIDKKIMAQYRIKSFLIDKCIRSRFNKFEQRSQRAKSILIRTFSQSLKKKKWHNVRLKF